MTACRIRIIGIDDLGGGEYSIRFTWHGPDWREALEEVKRIIPRELRSYDEGTRHWACFANAEGQMLLSTVFANFWGEVERIRFAQQSLFAEEHV